MEPREYLSKDWEDGSSATGGIFYRAFDLIKFIEKVEEQKGKVVCIKFDDSNNCEFLYQPKEIQS